MKVVQMKFPYDDFALIYTGTSPLCGCLFIKSSNQTIIEKEITPIFVQRLQVELMYGVVAKSY